MKEKNLVLILTLAFIIIGVLAAYFSLFSLFSPDFNFYESRLYIDGTKVSETLYYKTDKPYHTLYRNFESTLTLNSNYSGDNIFITDANCEQGRSYAYLESTGYTDYINSGNCYFFDKDSYGSCLPYTEKNEYGCSFGSFYGFDKGQKYKISAKYEANAARLFNVAGKNYVKFIAYSPDLHKYLRVGKNLFISGDAVYKKTYFPKDYVIIYLPYDKDIAGKQITNLDDFEYDDHTYFYVFTFIIAILPAILFFFTWFLFGKEKSYIDVPTALSMYPKERAGWEVAAYFAPPFNMIDKNFFSSMFLELYHKKAIDIQTEKGFFTKKLYIKINPNFDKSKLDNIQREFLKILKDIDSMAKESDKKNGYVDIIAMSKSFFHGSTIRQEFSVLEKDVKSAGKDYVDKSGHIFFYLLYGIIFLLDVAVANYYLIFVSAIIIITVSIFSMSSALMTQHKKDYYKEYQEWQAFKKYLEGAPSIREGKHKAVILWDRYMVYALALGVSKKAIKELHDKHMISNEQYNMSVNMIYFSNSFAASSGTHGASGGGGGFGGGGVGGGGGGGR